ncbi:MAG: GNAT family N-acetyltransferase [Bacteroidia bacterium]|nr:GNAT family N-acetyltransferase [Bacteroidia bacterium]
MNILHFSSQESEILGLKVARTDRLENFDPRTLVREILAGEFDLCKLKVNSTWEPLFQNLDATGFPWQIYSIIVRNQVDLTQTISEKVTGEIEFIPYTPDLEAEFMPLVKTVVEARTATNYPNPEIDFLIPAEKFVRASALYATGFHPVQRPNGRCWLLRKSQNWLGFVLGNHEGEAFEGILYGILPEYRGKGYAREIMRFLQDYARGQGLKYFENDVVFQNFSSLRPILQTQARPVGTYLNLTLNPLLNWGKKEVIQLKEPVDNLEKALSMLRKAIPDQIQIHEGKFHPVSHGLSADQCWFSRIQTHEKGGRIIFTLRGQNGEFHAHGWAGYLAQNIPT